MKWVAEINLIRLYTKSGNLSNLIALSSIKIFKSVFLYDRNAQTVVVEVVSSIPTTGKMFVWWAMNVFPCLGVILFLYYIVFMNINY